jgi:hypothetical protein
MLGNGHDLDKVGYLVLPWSTANMAVFSVKYKLKMPIYRGIILRARDVYGRTQRLSRRMDFVSSLFWRDPYRQKPGIATELDRSMYKGQVELAAATGSSS